MQTTRYAAVLFMVLVTAGATIALAVAVARMGMPVGYAAIGPVILAMILGLKWLEHRRKVQARKDSDL
jgi:enhancing lycopene biosynthesis protein 2